MTSADVFAWVEKNKRLTVPRAVRLIEDPPPANEDLSQKGTESFPEQVGPLEAIHTSSKEEAACCGDAEGSLERSPVSAVGQGSAFHARGGLSQVESAAQASADASAKEVALPCHLWAELPQIPVPVVAPEKSPEEKSCPHGAAVLPQHDIAMLAESSLEEIWFAYAICDKNCKDPLQLPSASALAEGTGSAPVEWPWSPEVPAKEEKLYSCAWCKQQFKKQINLESHYRYCRQKEQQQGGPSGNPWKPQKVPGEQGPRTPGSTRVSASSPLLSQTPSRDPSSDYGRGSFLPSSLCQAQRKPRAGKCRDTSDLGRSTTGAPRGPAVASVMKKLCRCQECGEKFVYKKQLLAHLRGHAENMGCRKDVGSQPPLSKRPREHAPKVAPAGVRGQKARVQRKAEDRLFYPCNECGKSFTKNYLPIHRAFHAGQRYKCLLCGIVFNFRSAAQRHKKQHRDNQDSATCPNCGKRAGARDCRCLIKKIKVAPKSNCST